MGKVLYWVGGVINWLAYVWLVTSETFEEICYAAISDPIRGIISAAETRQHAPKAEQRTFSRQNTPVESADNI
jgi:hypothetical protein